MRILVYGHYGKNNAGDTMFEEAFKKLFLEYTFVFTDTITKDKLQGIDAVIFGGGSMLEGAPNIDTNANELLWSKPILYIGVGAETHIHDKHNVLMRCAKLIAIRTPQHLEKIKALNTNVITTPDIVYCLDNSVKNKPIDKTILILPNMNFVPCHSSPHWKHIVNNLWRDEMAAACDILVDRGYWLRFYGMDQSDTTNDEWAAQDIINAMEHRGSNYIITNYYGSKSLMELFASFEMIITMRYHGIVMSEMAGVPYISIAHHDKLMGAGSFRTGAFFTTQEASKDRILKTIEAKEKQAKLIMDIDPFIELKKKVKEVLNTA